MHPDLRTAGPCTANGIQSPSGRKCEEPKRDAIHERAQWNNPARLDCGLAACIAQSARAEPSDAAAPPPPLRSGRDDAQKSLQKTFSETIAGRAPLRARDRHEVSAPAVKRAGGERRRAPRRGVSHGRARLPSQHSAAAPRRRPTRAAFPRSKLDPHGPEKTAQDLIKNVSPSVGTRLRSHGPHDALHPRRTFVRPDRLRLRGRPGALEAAAPGLSADREGAWMPPTQHGDPRPAQSAGCPPTRLAPDGGTKPGPCRPPRDLDRARRRAVLHDGASLPTSSRCRSDRAPSGPTRTRPAPRKPGRGRPIRSRRDPRPLGPRGRPVRSRRDPVRSDRGVASSARAVTPRHELVPRSRAVRSRRRISVRAHPRAGAPRRRAP